MGTALICDICGKPTDRIVTKVFQTPFYSGSRASSRNSSSNYASRIDVGDHAECVKKVVDLGKWHKRVNRKRVVKDATE